MRSARRHGSAATAAGTHAASLLAATSAVGWPRATSSAKLGPESTPTRAPGARALRDLVAERGRSRPGTPCRATAPARRASAGKRRSIALERRPSASRSTTTPPAAWRERRGEIGADLRAPAAARPRAGSGRCGAATRSRVACPASRAQSQVGCAARGVHRQGRSPRAGAEHRDVHAARACREARAATVSRGADRARAVARAPLAARLRLLRLVHRLEVDFRQHHRRKAGARADVGDDRAQVRVDDVRAGDAEDLAAAAPAGMLRISKMPPCLASTRNSVLSLTLVVTVAMTVTSYMPSPIGSAPSVEVDLDLRLALLEQDLRRVRLLERQILQVDALDLEHRGRAGCRRPCGTLGSRWGSPRRAAKGGDRRVRPAGAAIIACRPAAARARRGGRARPDRRSRRRACRR